ncbi:MAG TPA: type II secretion system F family protein [Actinomycetota bacterium]|nr:type II secretion system F family protein [Actinomycetota bacterium]
MIELVIVVAATAGAALFVSGLPPLRKRVLAARVDPYLGGLAGRGSGLMPPRRASSPLARFLETKWPRAVSGPEERLSAAGYDMSVGEFRLEQLTWGAAAAAGATGLVLIAASLGAPLDARGVPMLALSAFASGVLARDWWLSQEVAARRRELSEQLPVALDLVTLAIMAGEAVPAAFARVAGILRGGIGEELDRVVADVRAGAPVLDALEAMKNRLPDYGIVRFVDALCTGIERGAPLADVLWAQADDARAARRRHLMELGGRREVLMLVPVVFLILPVVVAIALLPGLVSLELLVP